MDSRKLIAATISLAIAGTIAVSAAPAQASTARVPSGCRTASSSYSGTAIYGRICWGADPDDDRTMQAWVNGSVTDRAGDGKYAMFRIHYRFLGQYRWHTRTEVIKTTKGKTAPVQLAVRSGKYRFYRIKDFWIQACKQGSGVRQCESVWH